MIIRGVWGGGTRKTIIFDILVSSAFQKIAYVEVFSTLVFVFVIVIVFVFFFGHCLCHCRRRI